MSKMKWTLLGMIVLISLGGPLACYPRVSVYSVIPPRLVMSNVRRVAILPFRPKRWGGKEGLVLADLIASRLSNSEARRLYKIVETSELSAVMREQSIRRDLADAEITGTGQKMDAQALIVGRVTSYHIGHRSWRKKEVYYRDGVKYTRYVRCLSRTGHVGATLRVIRTSDRSVIHSFSRYASDSSSGCGSSRYNVRARRTLFQRATDKLALALAFPLTPTVRRLVIPIETGGKDKRLDLGVKFARQKRWSRADELWRQVIRTNPRSHRALYNLGVAAEVRGNLRLARRFYKRAERLVPKSWYSHAMRRIQDRIQDRHEMKRLEKKAPTPSSPAITPADDPTAPGQNPTSPNDQPR